MKVRVIRRDHFGHITRREVITLGGTKEEQFDAFFKMENSHKYCNSVGHEMIDKELFKEYREYLTLGKYAELGGDTW
jgi:hypothetical protein